MKLNGIGPKLADWLTDKMEEYCDARGLPRPKKVGSDAKRTAELEEAVQNDAERAPIQHPPKKRKTQKQYIPKHRSGAYALLKALSAQPTSNRGMIKADLQREAQPFCDSSFTVPSDPTKYFTAWKSMDTLTDKELVCMVGKPVRKYMLTEEGWDIAQQMRAVEGSPSTGSKAATASLSKRPGETDAPGRARLNFDIDMPPPLSPDEESSPEPQVRLNASSRLRQNILSEREGAELPVLRDAFPEFSPILLPAGSFTIQLVLDNREVRTPVDRDYISHELQKQGVKPIIRPLGLGDAIWVAKIDPLYLEAVSSANEDDDGEGNDEIVLDYVMERKRLDDFIYSIKDGRYREQKYRLRRSGVKNIIYLVEEYSLSEERKETYLESLENAIAGMGLINGFFVKQTANLAETVTYLTNMTKALMRKYEGQDLAIIPAHALESCDFPAAMDDLRRRKPGVDHYVTFSMFTAMCDKSDSLTLRDAYLKMLMCIRGLTGDKAIEIQRRWPTPQALIDGFDAVGDNEAKKRLVSDKLGNLIPRKRVAKALSTKIAEVWG